MNDWLPNDYKVPESEGNYAKLRVGENRFRILDKPIMGTEYWVEDNGKRRPVRVRPDESIPVEYAEFQKHFWAMPIWNYATNSIQVFEITQKGIMKALTAYGRDKDWGSPLGYDIVINRTGEGIETEYEVFPKPHKELPNEIVDAWQAAVTAGFDMNRLYDGEHPHASSNQPTKMQTNPNNLSDIKFE